MLNEFCCVFFFLFYVSLVLFWFCQRVIVNCSHLSGVYATNTSPPRIECFGVSLYTLRYGEREVFLFFERNNASSVVQFCLNHRVDEMIERRFAAMCTHLAKYARNTIIEFNLVNFFLISFSLYKKNNLFINLNIWWIFFEFFASRNFFFGGKWRILLVYFL